MAIHDGGSNSASGRRPRDMRYGAAVAAGIGVALFLSVMPLIPPQPLAVDADPVEYSAERAIEHVRVVARESHPMGSKASAGVRSYIVEALSDMGLDPELQSVVAADYFGDPGNTVDVINLMARIPGTDSTGAVLLMGHYDTEPGSPGANDNATAVATLLETARALLAGEDLRNDVILLFTDGEEPAPRYGSVAFVSGHPWMDDVGFVLNFEAIGGSGPSVMIELSGPGRSMIDRYAAVVPSPAAYSLITEVNRVIGGSNTDFSKFRDAGVAGFDFAYIHGSPIYHTPADDVESVSLRSLQHHGSNALSLSRHFGTLDLAGPTDDGEVVFFTAAGSWVVRYPASWALPFAILIAIGFVAAAGRRPVRRLLSGAGIVLSAVLAGTVVSSVIWWLLTGVRRTPGMWESYLYLAVLLTVGASVLIFLMRRSGRRSGSADPAGGAVLIWVGLAVLTGATLPGAGYLFALPALAGVVVLGTPADGAVRPFGLLRTLAVAVPTLVVLVPTMDFFFQFAQPRPGNLDSEVISLISITLFFGLLAGALFRPLWVASDASGAAGLRSSVTD